MRRRAPLDIALLGCFLGTCGPPSTDEASAYLDDVSFRRARLVSALVNPDNSYARERLAHYATAGDGDWGRLPEWNPPAEPIAVREVGTGMATTLSPAAAPLELRARDRAALLALGQAAFRRYPAQLAPYFTVALSSAAAARRYGLWIDEAAGVGGLVRARMADGSGALAMTCSTCHTARDAAGALAPGLPDGDLDVGRAIVDAEGVPPALAAQDPLAAWGPGRLDVSSVAGDEPARIPDLRAVRWQSHLHHDATLRAGDLATLAIRIETLLITSAEEAVRPPRLVALALAAYVLSLGDTLPEPALAARQAPAGAALFAATCAGCHAGPGLTGAPVALAVIGTDPTLGHSPSRGTGAYRVPSLRGLGTRGPLLHDGTLPSIEALLDPRRLTGPFPDRRHGTGAVPGHAFGLDLPSADRAALIDYLRRL